MSIFAGVYNLDRRRPIEPEWRARLRQSASRHPENEVHEFEWPAAYMVHVDVGAYGYPSFASKEGILTALAGQLICDARPLDDRRHEVEKLGADVAAGGRRVLRSARGTFAASVYDPAGHTLWLAADRVGHRPIYCWSDGETVVFATALRILEALADLLRLELDRSSIAEMLAFGFPLGERTPYRKVRRLRAAELMMIGAGEISTEQWFRWHEVRPRARADKADLQELYGHFREAVVLRAGSDRTVRAFLSGGLDSRSIVSVLTSLDKRVQSYNISWPGTYDQVLAAEFADRCATVHYEIPLLPSQTGDAWPQLIGSMLAIAPPPPPEVPGRARVIWSGDGGSVGVGRVYLDRTMVELMRAGRQDAAVDAFLRKNFAEVPVRFLLARHRAEMGKLPALGMGAELAAMACEDRAQKLFVFLLENDQRRHLSGHYEDIDLNRIEYLLPFLDSEFLSASVSFRLDDALGHALYNRWLECFSGPVRDVPWQAYPGHEPSRMPPPAGYATQWEARRRQRLNRVALRECLERLRVVGQVEFPNWLLSRPRYLVASIADLVIGPRYTYAFSALNLLIHYARKCPTTPSTL